MSHKKMLQCSMGALFLLLPWFGGLVLGEISTDFSQCLDFFYKETPPTGIPAKGYQPICQRYLNRYRFATLYHRKHRSPLYSAYKLSGTGNRPKQEWMYEPQLAFSSASSEMQNFPKSTPVHQNVKESQAVDEDYKDSGFTKGHLNPSGHHKTEKDCRATFTLTNIVPQHKNSNNGPWNVLEQEVLKMQNFSKSTLVHQNVKESQAVDEDYTKSGFTRGHLNPSGHHKTEKDRRATFTLTNIVPQHKNSNNGPWNVLEQEVLKSFKDFCTGTMYVITGVMPFKSKPRWINNRVSVPKYMWSAYCCPSFRSDLPKSEQSFFPTYAALGSNGCCIRKKVVRVNAKAKPSVKSYKVWRMSLKNLEKLLRKRLGRTIHLFNRQCK